MDTITIKKNAIQMFLSVADDLNVEEIEDLQDVLDLKLHRLTDDGVYYTLEQANEMYKNGTTDEL